MLGNKQVMKTQAIILQCAFASCGMPTAPSVGEIAKYNLKWGGAVVSEYQLKRHIKGLLAWKYIETEYKPYGKRKVATYRITPKGAVYLLTIVDYLPKPIARGMKDLADRVAMGATAMINEYLSQGASDD